VMPVGKVKMTPEEQQAMEVDTAGKKAVVTEIGQERGKQAVSDEKMQRENAEFYGTTKETPTSVKENLSKALASVYSLGDAMQTIASFTGTNEKGEIYPERLPTGLGEPTFRAWFKRTGMGTEQEALMRERLNFLSATSAQLLFSLGGTQLTEGEQKALEALKISIEQDPKAFLASLAQVHKFIEFRAKAYKDTFAGQDTRPFDALIKGVRENSVLPYLPQIYKNVFTNKEGSGNAGGGSGEVPKKETAADILKRTMGGGQ